MKDDHARPKGRIYLYPMGGTSGEHRFTIGTFADLKAEGIEPADGMHLKFYDHDANENGDPDYLLFDGVIHRHSDGSWWAKTIEDRYWHESDQRTDDSK